MKVHSLWILISLTDSSRQTYFRELKKVIEMSDVILEVLDARDPQGCRCLALEQRILASSTQKRLILVLNKIGKSRFYTIKK